LNDVLKDLKENNIDVTQLEPFPTDHWN